MIKISTSNFAFLLSSLASSLTELGLHDIFFVGVEKQTAIFEAIFDLPYLTSLCLTGWLAGLQGIIPMLMHHSNMPYPDHPLQTLALSDGCLTSATHPVVKPRDLSSCWEAWRQSGLKNMNENPLSVSTSGKKTRYPNPLKIRRYKLNTIGSPHWASEEFLEGRWLEERRRMRELAASHGIQVDVTHDFFCDPLQRIGWMSQSI